MSPEPTTKGSAANPAPTASAGSPEHGGKRPLCRPRRHGRDFCRFRNRFDLRRTDLVLEFGVTRFDDVKPNAPITGRRYPACRLVLPRVAAVDLINRMQQVAPALT